jgi:hypothetical protein
MPRAPPGTRGLAAGECADDQEWLRSSRDRIRKRRVGGFVREIPLAGEKSQERTTPLRGMIANGPTQDRITFLKCVEDGLLRDSAIDFELHLAIDVGVHLEV